jgi:hypothetical protein
MNTLGRLEKLLLQGETPQNVANLLDYEYYSTFYHAYMKSFRQNPKFFFNLSNQNLSGIETDVEADPI